MFLSKNIENNNYLKWFDVIILTIIFCGSGIVTSTTGYLSILNGTADVSQSTVFTASDNYSALFSQGTNLLVAILYLVIRKFNFRNWNIQFNLKSIGLGILIFIGAGLLMDLYAYIVGLFTNPIPISDTDYVPSDYQIEMVSTVIYSLFNGFYEEIYFLGLCLLVEPKHLKWIIPFSLLIRVSFHTYQGLTSAFGIGLVFGIYMLFTYYKTKSKNLLPFFIGHALGDIFGLTIINNIILYLNK